jgi:hypothetical protein
MFVESSCGAGKSTLSLGVRSCFSPQLQEMGAAAKITGVTVDVTCGTTSGLNYKIPPIAFVQG